MLIYIILFRGDKMSLENVSIPNYSRKQEIFNAVSHFIGVFLALIIFFFALTKVINQEMSLFYFFGLLIFSLTAGAVYLISATYHYLDKDSRLKKIFRVIDHCTIYLLIAGTYTPICFVLMNDNIIGLIMLIIEWTGAIVGIVLKAFFFDKKIARVISFLLYVIMGWLALYSGGFLYMPAMCFAFILAGGITYTIGSILYALGHKNTNFHCVFHVFVLVSTIIQMIGVFYLFM